jgi:uncharacterized protein YjiS (DUF1127 family)
MFRLSKETENAATTDERPHRKDDPMRFANALRSFRKARETASELNRLSNRELADLGISRSDIPALAREASR